LNSILEGTVQMTDEATASPHVRLATATDAPALLPLMRGLAEYEGYADRFVITEAILVEQGFRSALPDFECLVADTGDGTIAGMLVFYLIPFTFSARPTFFIKELFVAPVNRGSGVGEQLMRAASAESLRRGCGLIKWQVARWNSGAIRFYERLGASPDPEWVDYALSSEACVALAAGSSSGLGQ
jgi:GNAT superfamily N-acetyltransferase